MRRLAIVAIFIVAVVLLAPAALLESPLAARTQGRARLVDSEGVWWKGRGTLVLGDGNARLPIAWRTEFLPMLRGVLVTHAVDDGSHAAVGTIAARAGRVEVRDARVRLPAQLAGALDPRMQAITVGGTIAIDAPALDVGRTPFGELHAEWERARIVAGETVIDFGTVTLAAKPASDGWTGTIASVGGDLTIMGTFDAGNRGFNVALSLLPTAATPPNVREALPMLGGPDGSGGVRMTWHGGLPQ